MGANCVTPAMSVFGPLSRKGNSAVSSLAVSDKNLVASLPPMTRLRPTERMKKGRMTEEAREDEEDVVLSVVMEEAAEEAAEAAAAT